VSIDVQGPGAAQADARALDRDIVEALAGLVKQAGVITHSIAASFGVAPSDLLALFKMDGVLTMKELAQKMGCDASFVTVVADTLEREGLARRAPCQRDRRVKNLLLTPEGIAAKERLMHELATRMPWCTALDDAERRCFLDLLTKMLASRPGDAQVAGESGLPVADGTARSE
jgi:DNA-binding MarR family transcriptional regulator